MPKIITTDYLNEEKFYKIPKAFFHNPLYKNMKNETKIAYAILRDLLELSIKNNWINEKHEVYVKLSRSKMMYYLNIKGTQKYSDIMKELIDKELIVKKRVGLNRVDETYVCIPEELTNIYNDEELLEYEENEKNIEKSTSNIDNSRKFENQTSRSLKIKPQEVLKSNFKTFENQTHTNTNITKTNINSISSSSNELNLKKIFEENICELKKTTNVKFEKWCKKVKPSFIIAIIEYGAETGAKSYAWFERVITSNIDKGIQTADDFNSNVNKFREKSKQIIDKSKNKKSNKGKKVDSFNNFEHRNYNFNELEKDLLNYMNEDK